jgi:SAM-dependent methyltransferase
MQLGALQDGDYFAGRVLATPLDGGRLWRCADCRSMFRHPVLPAARYLALYQSGAPDQWQGADHREDLRIIRSIVADGKISSVLDVGCGAGEFLASLPAGIARFGIEPSAAASVAQSRGIDVLAPELASWREPGQFAAVTIIDVIEHIPEPRAFLTEAYLRVAPGGLLIVSTGNPEAFLWRRVLGARFWYATFPEHVTFPGLGFFQQWCHENGATLVQQRETRYQRLHPAHLVVGLAMQAAFFVSPRAFNLVVRSIYARPTRKGERRRTFSPAMPGTFVDHQIVVIGKPGP